MDEADFTVVNDQSELDAFLDLVWGFHDALLREVSLVSRGYVDADGMMYGDTAPYDARLVFHSQKDDTPWIELIFEDFQVFQFDPHYEFKASGTIDQGEITVRFGGSSWPKGGQIKARTMKYRIGGADLLGKGVRTVSPIPREVSDETDPRNGTKWSQPLKQASGEG